MFKIALTVLLSVSLRFHLWFFFLNSPLTGLWNFVTVSDDRTRPIFHFCFHLGITLFCFLCLLPGVFLIYLLCGNLKLCSLLSSIQFGDPQLKMKLEKFFKPEK